jgi:replicative DNA helicase Mcm
MADKYNVSQEKVEEIVRNLRQKGVIYEPATGQYRIIE